MLPNIIVIGAARCGTTSLWRYLDLHPEVAMSARKELNFFADHPGSTWSKGLDWYGAQFDSSAPLRGEASPNYTVYPAFGGAAERIAATVPDARLIYLVRDPVTRLLSAYRTTRFVWGIEQRELDEAVADPESARLVITGCYAMQLERYLACGFSLEQIHVLDLADLVARRARSLRAVFEFVGADPSFVSPAFSRQHNSTEGLRATGAGHGAIHLLDRTLGPHRSAALRARVPDALVRPLLRRPDVPEVSFRDPGRDREVRARLHQDAERLRSLLGRPFSDWSV